MLSRQVQPQKVYFLIVIVSLLPFVVVGFLRDLGAFEFIELQSLDARLHWTAPPSPQISSQMALITIDAKSEGEEKLGLLPWDSYVYTSLIHSLQQIDPKAIGLVVWFNRELEDELPGRKAVCSPPLF